MLFCAKAAVKHCYIVIVREYRVAISKAMSSSLPLVCSHYSMKAYQATACQLQGEADTLKAQVVELQATLEATSSSCASTSGTVTSFASAVEEIKVTVAPTCTQTGNTDGHAPWKEVV